MTEKKLKDIWGLLPDLEHTRKYIDEKSGLRIYEVCGKKFQETVSIDYIIPILEQYYQNYGERAKLAKLNLSLDWKAISHAVRAALQVRQLLISNNIVFPLREAPLLLQIKKGELDYSTQVAPLLEGLMDEIETLAAESNLPLHPDYKFWEKWLIDTLEEQYYGK